MVARNMKSCIVIILACTFFPYISVSNDLESFVIILPNAGAISMSPEFMSLSRGTTFLQKFQHLIFNVLVRTSISWGFLVYVMLQHCIYIIKLFFFIKIG